MLTLAATRFEGQRAMLLTRASATFGVSAKKEAGETSQTEAFCVALTLILGRPSSYVEHRSGFFSQPQRTCGGASKQKHRNV